MRTKLDHIEARLQALIESSVALFAQGDAQHRLAHQLIQAARESIENQSGDSPEAPGLYLIYLHPDSLAYWQAHRDQLDSIGRSLQAAAREYGLNLRSDPVLRLAPEPSLPLDGIRVEARQQMDEDGPGHLGHTAAFMAVPPAPANAIPNNAFLIVEGQRVVPLQQMVINIGRRADNHLVLHDPRVSRSHAQIRAVRGQYVLFDLNSTGGTLVNGRRINQCTLKPGDVISLSGVPLIYGEDLQADDESDPHGYTQSMDQRPDLDPPEVIG